MNAGQGLSILAAGLGLFPADHREHCACPECDPLYEMTREGDAVEACPDLIAEMDRFLDDPITEACGVGGEMSGLVYSQHMKRHQCQGYGG